METYYVVMFSLNVAAAAYSIVSFGLSKRRDLAATWLVIAMLNAYCAWFDQGQIS